MVYRWDERKVSNYKIQKAIWFDNEPLTLGPRPKLKNIKNLPQQVIFTLLNPEEHPEDIKQATLKAGKAWVHAPLDARGHSMSDWSNWLEAAIALKKVLDAGATVYLHCAAGIHRTGSLTYLYYRLDGYGTHESQRKVFKLRPVIEDQIGDKMTKLEALYVEAINVKTLRDYYEE